MSNLPRRIRESPEVKKWLESQDEFVLDDFLEPHTVWNRSWPTEKAHFMAALQEVKDTLGDPDKTVIELFLQFPPRRIAVELGVSRREAYMMVRNAKNRAMRAYKQLQREPPRPKLAVRSAPVRTVRFVVPDRPVSVARLILQDDGAIWVDADDGIYSDEVQDLLSGLRELEPGFEILDVLPE